MVNKWKTTSLRDLGVQLIDCEHKTPKAANEGLPYICIPQMDTGRINFDANPRLISEEDFLIWTRKANPTYGDIILSRRCNPGDTAYVPKETKFALGQNLVLLRPTGDRLHPEYLRWATQGKEWWDEVAKYLNPGAIFDSLKCADILKFRIPEPPKYHQIKISEMLAALSDKIELNRKINQTLESMAQAMFKSWFVDFDPVIDNALKAGNPIPKELQERADKRAQLHQSGLAKGLPEDIQALFPDRFVLSEEMGWMPEGWEFTPLKASTQKISKGTTPTKKEMENATDFMSIPFLKVRDITDTGYIKHSTLDKIPKSIHDTSLKRSQLKSGDILISIAGTIGRVALVTNEFNNSNLNQAIAFIRALPSINPMFILESLKSTDTQDRINSRIVQAVQANLSLTVLGELPILSPCDQVIKLWTLHTNELYSKIYLTNRKSKKLQEIRETLLPKLISGDLRIPEAKAQVQEALSS